MYLIFYLFHSNIQSLNFRIPEKHLFGNKLRISILETTLDTHMLALVLDPVSAYCTSGQTTPGLLEKLKIVRVKL